MPIIGITDSQKISKYLGFYEPISTVNPSGTQTVTFNSIPSTYKHLQLRILSQQDYSTSSDFGWVNLTFNGSSSSYAGHWAQGPSSGTPGYYAYTSFGFIYTADSYLIPSSNNSGIFGAAIIDIYDYASTAKNKTMRVMTGVDWNGGGMVRELSGVWQSTSAITSISFNASNGNLKSGSKFALYGIKG